MSAAVVDEQAPPGPFEELLDDVLHDLNVELSSCYSNRCLGKWKWVTKHCGRLYVHLLDAADFWEESGRMHVAARLRARAEVAWLKRQEQRALAQQLREAVCQ